ncbi:MAG: hypothetical protein RLZZ488_2118 [Pseudomonadota bacterium]|jgi:hypothetical protein
MSRKTKLRSVKRGSKSVDWETVILLWTIAIAGVVVLAIVFSMGSRRADTDGAGISYFDQLRNRVRGWQAPFVAHQKQNIPDSRTHSGFHFQWNQKLNPPNWKLEQKQGVDRNADVLNILKIGRAKVTLHQLSDRPELFELRETLSKDGSALVSKRILPLLPGEQLALSYSSLANSKLWKLRLRTIGTTQDRLDAPLKILHGFDGVEPTQLDVDPRGTAVDLDIPSAGEFARNGAKIFHIQWPETASGLLSVEGLQLPAPENEQRAGHLRTLIVHLDKLDHSLTALNQTLAALKKATASRHSTIHLKQVIPPTEDPLLSQKSLLTWRTPVELGATLSNGELKTFVNSEPTLLKKYSARGGSVRRMTISPSAERCKNDCSIRPASDSWADDFSSSVAVSRRDEISSLTSLVRKDAFFNDAGLLLVDLQFPAEELRLNWTTAFRSDLSFLHWVHAGLRSLAGLPTDKFNQAEKTAQTDALLAQVIESFFATSSRANVAIFLHKKPEKSKPADSLATHAESSELAQGEALLSMLSPSEDDTATKELTAIDRKISLLNVIKLFEKLSYPKDEPEELAALTDELAIDAAPVTQLNKSTLTTLTTQGWLKDPLPNLENRSGGAIFSAKPAETYSVQEKAQSERRRSRLNSLHLLLPNNNEKDEALSLTLQTNLKPLACESESEHAQLEPRSAETAPTPDKLQTYKILGRRNAQSQWHVHCLLDGRITTNTRLRIVARLNNESIARDRIGLGEFSLPVRGFLWRSPETLELTGAQILDATSAVSFADKDSAKQTSVVIWTDSVPTSIEKPRAVFATPEVPVASPAKEERLSGK